MKKVENEINKSIGMNMKFLRTRKKITQVEMAEILGLHQTAISRVEDGKQNLTPLQLWNLAETLGVKIEDLYA